MPWRPREIEPPVVQPALHRMGAVERSAEVIRYAVRTAEYWVSPQGSLREWLRLNFWFALVLAVPALTELSSEAESQLTLFAPKTDNASTRLDTLVDQLNRRYGSNTVRYGSMGFDRKWRMRQERKSRGFTTRWEELLVARA